MSTKLTGIIYRAYNTVSGKSYVGQSQRKLTDRIKEHYKNCKRYNHKFANALKYYKSTDWEWTILREVEVGKLDEWEAFFVTDLDTYKNGYNSTEDGKGCANTVTTILSTSSTGTIFELYHKEKGFLRGRRQDLVKVEPSLKRVYELANRERRSIKGWVLVENKDTDPETYRNGGIHEFFHQEKGQLFTGRASEFHQEHLLNLGIPLSRVHSLIRGKSKECSGWTLVKRGTCPYLTVETITLQHDRYGIVTSTIDNFVQQFGLTRYGIGELNRGTRKHHRDWSLVTEDK